MGVPLFQVTIYRSDLVILSPIVDRESASREIRRYCGAGFYSATNASDIGAYKSWQSGERLVFALLWCLEGMIKRHTYRLKEIR